jgi:hypothetical protein
MTLLLVITLLDLSTESMTDISDKIFSSLNPSTNKLWNHCIIFLDFFNYFYYIDNFISNY